MLSLLLQQRIRASLARCSTRCLSSTASTSYSIDILPRPSAVDKQQPPQAPSFPTPPPSTQHAPKQQTADEQRQAMVNEIRPEFDMLTREREALLTNVLLPGEIPPAEDPLVHYMTSFFMQDGLRHRALKRTSNLLLHLRAFTSSPPLPILRAALEQASPSVKLIGMKRGSKRVYHPTALREKQRYRIALKWIDEEQRGGLGKTIEERVARVLIAILQGESGVLRKKTELHTLATISRGNIKMGR